MKTTLKSLAPAENEHFSVLQYHGSNVAVEEINGNLMFNAAQMAKPFGKQPNDWLKTQQSSDLLTAMTKRKNIRLADLVHVRRGGKNPGTLFQEDVALIFAQWLSPEFYIACNDKLKELLKTRALILPTKHGVTPIAHNGRFFYSYIEAMKALGGSTRGSASRRKHKHPNHFVKLFGRNFITAQYFDLLNGYYAYKNAQLKLNV